MLVIFTATDRTGACEAALSAAEDAPRRIAEVNRRKSADQLPTAELYLGLHVGEVFYGNIGSDERLDFTIVGPAVNEVSRIASMCRSVDQPLLVSSAFAAALGASRNRLISVSLRVARSEPAAGPFYACERPRRRQLSQHMPSLYFPLD